MPGGRLLSKEARLLLVASELEAAPESGLETSWAEEMSVVRPMGARELTRPSSRLVKLTALSAAASLFVAGGTACGAWAFGAMTGVVTGGASSTGARQVVALSEDVRRCGPAVEDVDFEYHGGWFDHIDHIGSVAECCDKCKEEPRCDGFTWVKDAKLPEGNPGQCWRKSGTMTGRSVKKGVISGFREAKDSAKHAAAHEANAVQQRVQLPDSAPEDKVGDVEETRRRSGGSANSGAADGGAAAGSDAAADSVDDGAVIVDPGAAGPRGPSKEDPGAAGPSKPSGPSKEEFAHCAAEGEGCLDSKCCKDAGYQCFSKNHYWAQCMTECQPGPNPLDQVSPMPWSCEALGDRTPGDAPKCAKDNEDCVASQCCAVSGMKCYHKNETYGQCKTSCEPGPDLRADDSQPWTCDEVGDRTLGAAPWVAEKCAKGGADCSSTHCCAEPGMQCYLQSQYWGECKPSCEPGRPTYPGGPLWACTPVGTRTPSVPAADDAGKGVVGAWVEEKCSWPESNCAESKCCLEIGATCVTKDDTYATCKRECSKAPDPKDGNKTWECKELGPKSWGLSTKGYPSLLCITLYMPSRYEGPLLKEHLKKNAGIFECDAYDVFAAENDTLGTAKDGTVIKANIIPKIEVGISQDGTAGNAKLFMALWDKVIAMGRFRFYDFTIKVDPDAVIIPWRVRTHMKPHVGANAYVVNCNKFPGSPNFPMMFGAVEIFSYAAMTAYAMGSWKCGSELPWGAWGEDYYMTHCLDFLGVGRINDFGVLGDNVCTGANCLDTFVGSFHPFKDQDSWFKCWDQATR